MNTEGAGPDSLSLTFGALADPTRRAILSALRRGEASVTQLAEPFALSLPAITKHLKVLERAGLIARSRDSRWRPSRLDAGPLREASDWIGGYRDFWEAKFDRLDAYLKELQTEDGKKEKDDE
jgi:DNA-binding transcriptional ArsR family regulator